MEFLNVFSFLSVGWNITDRMTTKQSSHYFLIETHKIGIFNDDSVNDINAKKKRTNFSRVYHHQQPGGKPALIFLQKKLCPLLALKHIKRLHRLHAWHVPPFFLSAKREKKKKRLWFLFPRENSLSTCGLLPRSIFPLNIERRRGETRDLAAASSNGSAPERRMMEGLQLSWKRRVGVEPGKMGIRLFCYWRSRGKRKPLPLSRYHRFNRLGLLLRSVTTKWLQKLRRQRETLERLTVRFFFKLLFLRYE